MLNISFKEIDNDCLKKIFIYDNIRIARIIDEEGFYTKYFITSRGVLFSLLKAKIKVYKPATLRNKYKTYNLSLNKKSYHVLVHRLVAEAFIPNPENKLQVNHKDGIKSHNYIENLEWNTPKENMEHSYKTGLHKIEYGENSNNPSITEKTARKICKLLEENLLTLDEIAAQCNTTKIIVFNIKHKIAWIQISDNYCVENHTIRADGHIKMTEETCKAICIELEKNELTIREIAEKYDVSYDQVSEIRQKKTWLKVSKNYKIENHNLRPSQKKNRHKVTKICELLAYSDKSKQDIAKECDAPISLVEGILYHNTWQGISSEYNFDKRYTRKKK